MHFRTKSLQRNLIYQRILSFCSQSECFCLSSTLAMFTEKPIRSNFSFAESALAFNSILLERVCVSSSRRRISKELARASQARRSIPGSNELVTRWSARACTRRRRRRWNTRLGRRIECKDPIRDWHGAMSASGERPAVHPDCRRPIKISYGRWSLFS